ncbi:peptide deformylase [Chondromyces crocatus]|uniref:Peptide deformylase n=1 Tax=Chondromyces crocatus TaxID=52 RepID=A0A0K1E8A9_CHOCO|nr:peptide deformylase [Chondromyces crocatus]AKT37084.1 peptide deformylase [Chondromyces crocatus]
MKLPKIVQAGDPVLRTPAAPVPAEMIGTRKLKELVSTMVEVMRKAPGVGLAAPQIGIGLQIMVLEDGEALMGKLSVEDREVRGRAPFPLTAIVNPTLTPLGSSLASPGGAGRATFFEGCLSVAGYMALVERDLRVEVTGIDPDGQPIRWVAEGWPARILQHETDHLRGTLYVDRMLTRSYCSNEEAQRWINLPVAEVRAALGV